MSDIELSREDLPEDLQVMADKIGMDKTRELLSTFGGSEIYFPHRQVMHNAGRRYVRDNFKKESISRMVRNTGMSRTTIFNYLNSKPRKSR